MPKPANPQADGPEFDRFLHAAVGEDRNGALVTVFSTLARLGLDPRKEASELAMLPDDAALHRLEALLKRFFDVPALGDGYQSVAQTLVPLLPRRHASAATGAFAAAGRHPRDLVMPIVAVLLILALLAQVFLAGLPGSGD